MKLLIPLLGILCCLSLPGHALAEGATNAPPSDAAKNALQETTTAAKKDLVLKQAALDSAQKAKAEAEKARDAGDAKIKTLKEQVDNAADATAKKNAQDNYNSAAAAQLDLLKTANEKSKDWNIALDAELAAENKLNSLQGNGSTPAQQPAAGSAPAPATQNPLTLGNEKIYQASLAALTKLFVVAVLLESGLALIFNSALFLAFVSRRTTRPVIMFFAALILVCSFDLNILAQLINAYNSTEAGGAPVTGLAKGASVFISSLILAGGSAGVFNVMASLGFRNKHEGDSAPTAPGPEHAWVSVRLTNFAGADQNVKINIEKIDPPATNPPAATAGTIPRKRPGLVEFIELLRPVKGRFPSVAGYSVEANQCYKIEVKVKTTTSTTHPDGERDLLNGKGIYKFAPRAIVDLEVPYTAG